MLETKLIPADHLCYSKGSTQQI